MGRPTVSDVVIAGGGIIGLSIGLELRQRGLSVAVLERHHAMRGASWAAGGMLAARDPENPPQMLTLALRSLELYPAYLERVQSLSRREIPIRTRRTLQSIRLVCGANRDTTRIADDAKKMLPGLSQSAAEHCWSWLEEDSLDPRDLCDALPAAFLAEGGILLEGTAVLGVRHTGHSISVETARASIHAGSFINCCGAWAGELRLDGLPVEPIKGQMVSVALGPERLRCVLRTPEFYAIPRGDGRVSIGATVERAGFDPAVHEESITNLLRTAARLLPELGTAARLESWAGFRPGTPDGLPILGRLGVDRCWHATGHFRNGVLLAPATARAMADAILGNAPEIALDAFSPARFLAGAYANDSAGPSSPS